MANHQSHVWLRPKDIAIAYALLRIAVGVNYFNHGWTRIGNIPRFVDAMVQTMQESWIPEALVRLNAALVPPVELVVGLLIAIGLLTRGALIACFVLMIVLMYGVTIIQNWDAAGSQLIYNITLFILLAGLGFNTISIDHWLNRKRQ
ncbi:MAG: DoxX family protein [Cyanobacteriota bacterium]|nr:DoxX family protein [Cyanobacteriota bacterium]